MAALILFGELVLVGKHAVPAIDIAPAKWFWGLMEESCSHLGFMSPRGVEPGFWQAVDRVVYPGWTSNPVAPTEPFDRGSTEGGPPESIDAWCVWKDEWISNESRTVIFGIVKPLIHEIAQRYPRSLTLTDGLIRQSHGLYMIMCFHSISR